MGKIEAAVAMATLCSTNALAQDQALLQRLAKPLDEAEKPRSSPATGRE
jgi:hypothetical protein